MSVLQSVPEFAQPVDSALLDFFTTAARATCTQFSRASYGIYSGPLFEEPVCALSAPTKCLWRHFNPGIGDQPAQCFVNFFDSIVNSPSLLLAGIVCQALDGLQCIANLVIHFRDHLETHEPFQMLPA